jgi:hypothetical protein
MMVFFVVGKYALVSRYQTLSGALLVRTYAFSWNEPKLTDLAVVFRFY